MTEPNLNDEIDVPTNVNKGLTVATPQLMGALLGCPRISYTAKCQPMTNKDLFNKHIISQSVGPFKVTGLRPAVENLVNVLVDIAKEQPLVYSSLGSAGMLCCRNMGNKPKVSNHSWGIAIDLLINKKLDPYNNKKTYYGLSLIAPIFNRHGWFWGGRYRTSEDAMHFEVSKEKLLAWAQLGLLGPDAQKFATKKETLKLQGAAKPAKSNENLTSRVLAGQATKPPLNPLAPPPLPPSSHFLAFLQQRPNQTFPNWYGANGWVSKCKSKFSWLRK